MRVKPEAGIIIHLSQATLGESKKKAESVFVYANVRGQKVCLGTLSDAKFSQISFDLVFDSEFELSHTWKHGSVFFIGYRVQYQGNGEEFDISSSDVSESDEEETPAAVAKEDKSKADTEKAKPSAKAAEPSEDGSSDEDDDSSGDDESEEEAAGDKVMASSDEDLDDSDESSEEEEDTPVKAEVSKKDGKKRQANSDTQTPQAKKGKSATPEKTDGKKGVHTATPHPAKGKSAAQTPKSSAQLQCNTCSKTFHNDKALQSHSKAKHGGK